MSKYEYAQLYTHLREGFYTAAFISPEGRSQKWPAQSYVTVHLNRAADDGWRVVNEEFHGDEDVSYLLERERGTQAGVVV